MRLMECSAMRSNTSRKYFSGSSSLSLAVYADRRTMPIRLASARILRRSVRHSLTAHSVSRKASS